MRLILTNPATSPNNRLILAYADYMLHACRVGCLTIFKYEIQTSSSRHQSNEKISAERRLSRYLQTFVHCAALGTSGLDAVIHRNLVTVCSASQSSPSWLQIRILALNDRFHQQRAFAGLLQSQHSIESNWTSKVGADHIHLRYLAEISTRPLG